MEVCILCSPADAVSAYLALMHCQHSERPSAREDRLSCQVSLSADASGNAAGGLLHCGCKQSRPASSRSDCRQLQGIRQRGRRPDSLHKHQPVFGIGMQPACQLGSCLPDFAIEQLPAPDCLSSHARLRPLCLTGCSMVHIDSSSCRPSFTPLIAPGSASSSAGYSDRSVRHYCAPSSCSKGLQLHSHIQL